jgi:hypothetical protein
MDTPRKIGFGIVMIIPSFVFGAAVWAMLESWLAVFISQIIMALVYSSIAFGWPVPLAQKGRDADPGSFGNSHAAEH